MSGASPNAAENDPQNAPAVVTSGASAESDTPIESPANQPPPTSHSGPSSVLDDARKANRAATIRGALIVLLLIALSLSWRARNADAGAREAAEMALAAQRAGDDTAPHLRECEERRDVCIRTLRGFGRPLAWIGHSCSERCEISSTAPAAEPAAQ